MKKRELIINLVLMSAVLVLAYLVFTAGARTQRAEDINKERMKEITSIHLPSATQPIGRPETLYLPGGATPTPVPGSEVRFTNFGKQNIFEVPVPKVTPTPTPEPTPIPPPSLEQAMMQWKLQGIAGKTAYLHDEATTEDFQMDVNGPSRPIMTAANMTLDMTLIATDEQNMTITLKSHMHEQPYVMKMF